VQTQQPSIPTSGTFVQPGNVFASPVQQQAPVSAFPQPQQPVSAFATSTTAAPTPAFGQPANAFAPQPPAGQAPQSAFGQTAFTKQQQPTNAFGGGSAGPFGNLLNPQKEAPVVAMAGGGGAGSANGKWDDPPIQYTEEELQEFREPAFRLGKIPLVPPPPEMCR